MYDDRQTIFRLAMASQLGASVVGSVDQIESEGTANITDELRRAGEVMGTWKTVWGLSVKSVLFHVADNAMFVAEKSDAGAAGKHLVIAIAGTNPRSTFDLLIENASVLTLRPWPYGNPPNLKPMIASGSLTGLEFLQQLIPGPTQPGSGLKLREFLSRYLNGPTRVTITAHSLGSALGCLLALWLFETRQEWDPHGHAALDCVLFAGPTSGNADFSTYYTNSEIGKRTSRCFNLLDGVPHVWNTNDLEKIPNLYRPIDQVTKMAIGVLVNTVVVLSSPGHFLQICPDSDGGLGPGKFNDQINDPRRLGLANFVAQWNYQHVGAYFDLLNMGPNAQHLRDILEGKQTPSETPEAVAELSRQLDRNAAIVELRKAAMPALEVTSG
jgi:Lipase (class 3)